MSDKILHLIAFDIPVPANYGGAIDVFYKLKSFNETGVKVILHCFEYDRSKSEELESLCHKIHYYKRKISKAKLFRRKPYIVVTRSSEDLLINLLKDNYPIVFEGLHTCYHLDNRYLINRIKIVRTHNIEHDYYNGLANVEKNIFKRYYFLNEASKLVRFQKVLYHANGIAAISDNDKQYFEKKFRRVNRISAFHPDEKINIREGRGEFALYHGSLEVGENNEAAMFLTEKIFNDIEFPLYIAGNRPSKELIETATKYPNIKILSNLDASKISELIREAQINILPTFQETGIKLKLLAALYKGRHCIVNSPMVVKTGLADLCHVHDSVEDLKKCVKQLFDKDFESESIEKREDILTNSGFSNSFNIEKLNKMIFD